MKIADLTNRIIGTFNLITDDLLRPFTPDIYNEGKYSQNSFLSVKEMLVDR